MIYQARPEFAELLERAGIRQKELAERIHMSRFSLSHIAARRRNIGGAFASRIASAYSEITHSSQDEALGLLFVVVAEKKYDVRDRKRTASGRFLKEAEVLEAGDPPDGDAAPA